MGSTTVRTRAWAWYLAAVVFATQYYVVSAHGATANDTLHLAIGLSAVGAGVAGLLLGGVEFVAGRLVLLASIVAYLAGDAVLSNLEETNVLVPFPSLADWLYLSVYPALLLAAVLIARGRGRSGGRRLPAVVAVVVAAIATFVAAAAVSWWWYAAELWDSPFLDDTQRRVALAYPLGDALVLAAGVAVLVAGGRRIGRHTLFAGAAAALTVGNTVYNVEALGSGHEAGGLASVGWLAFTALLGATALCPAIVASTVEPDDVDVSGEECHEGADEPTARDADVDVAAELDAEAWLDAVLGAADEPVLTDV